MGTVHGCNSQTRALPTPGGHDPNDHDSPHQDATGIAWHNQPPFGAAGDLGTPMRTGAASAGPDGVGRGRYRTVHRGLDPSTKNERVAQANRAWLAYRGVLLVHLVGCRGAGKTALLEALVTAPGEQTSAFALEGGRAASLDPKRLSRAGCRALQINTGSDGHLDAMIVARSLLQLNPPRGSTVFIESARHLACPVGFDLGERAKIVVMSVTEGDDKPLKYPELLRAADLLVVNKIDLLPYLEFDVERCVSRARSARPALPIVCLSTRTGEGLAAVATWFRHARGSIALARSC